MPKRILGSFRNLFRKHAVGARRMEEECTVAIEPVEFRVYEIEP